MLLSEAIRVAGSLSETSKMPGFSYGLPAQECKVGSVLRGIPNSVCSKCYALKGLYSFPKPQRAMYHRLNSLTHPQWVEAMSTQISVRSRANRGRRDPRFFRWHDSGDIQDFAHLCKIVEVAEALPKVKFWLPTREKKVVNSYLNTAPFPKNLIVRVSATMIDEMPFRVSRDAPFMSGVFSTDKPMGGRECPARFQNDQCGDCRACWDARIPIVMYHLH